MSYDEKMSKMEDWSNRSGVSIIGMPEGENSLREKHINQINNVEKFPDVNKDLHL